MKRINTILILLSLLTTSFFVSAQQVIVTDDASYTTPASGAMLDVKSTSRGFMPPRVALTSLTDIATIASPSTGLIVYNTGTAGLAEAGIYYWNGAIWSKPITGGTGGTNYVSIATDGTVILHGAATTWNDLVVVPFTLRNSGNNVPAWELFAPPDLYNYNFTNVDDKFITFTVQMPHDYKEGTNIYPHVHWSSNTAPGMNRVTWKLEYQWVNHSDVFSASTSTLITGATIAGADRSLQPYEHTITKIGTDGINGTGKTISSMLFCRLTRLASDGLDTFTGSAFLLSFDFHYEIDSFGSSQEYVK